MITFELDEDQRIVQETVHDFARDVLRPGMRAWEKAGAVPDDVARRFRELGLGLIDVPESLGGGGAGAVTAALVHEELAWGDPGAAVALFATHPAAAAIVELGDEAQARRWLGRFGDGSAHTGAVAYSERGGPVDGFATRATKTASGWRLDGKKAWVTHGGRADLTVVFAQVDQVDADTGWQGVGAFVVEKGNPGLREAARHELLGLETVHVAELVIDGCEVPDDARLVGGGHFLDGAARFLARMALVTAARQVGLARASYEFALEYTQERKAFGKPVAHFQSIAFTLADMHMDVESARWMVWRAAAGIDHGKLDLAEIAAAAAHANEAAWRVADNGVQLLGGAGYIQDYPVEKWLRDTKVLALSSPTSESLAEVVAGAALGQPIGAPLPSTAIQPILT